MACGAEALKPARRRLRRAAAASPSSEAAAVTQSGETSPPSKRPPLRRRRRVVFSEDEEDVDVGERQDDATVSPYLQDVGEREAGGSDVATGTGPAAAADMGASMLAAAELAAGAGTGAAPVEMLGDAAPAATCVDGASALAEAEVIQIMSSRMQRRASARSSSVGAAQSAQGGGGLADSDAEESAVEGDAPAGTAGGERTGRGSRRLADSEAESADGLGAVASSALLDAWALDLAERRRGLSFQSAFARSVFSAREISTLPPESRLAGHLVYDHVGMVNLHLLVGAYRQVRTTQNLDCLGEEEQHLCWLVRKASELGLVDAAELRRGRVRRGRGRGERANVLQAVGQPMLLLAAEEELRFPSRPSQARPLEETGNKDLVFSDCEEEVQRHVRRQQAIQSLKLRSTDRQARIGSLSSNRVDLQQVHKKLSGPRMSFDLQAENFDEEDDDDQLGEGLSVDIGRPNAGRGADRDLLRVQLQQRASQKKVQNLLLQDMVLGELRQDGPSSGVDAERSLEAGLHEASPGVQQSAEEPMKPLAPPQGGDASNQGHAASADPPDPAHLGAEASPASDPEDMPMMSRRRSRRVAFEDDADPSAPCTTISHCAAQVGEAPSMCEAPTAPGPHSATAQLQRETCEAGGPPCSMAMQPPPKKKQALLADVFAGASHCEPIIVLEEVAQSANQANEAVEVPEDQSAKCRSRLRHISAHAAEALEEEEEEACEAAGEQLDADADGDEDVQLASEGEESSEGHGDSSDSMVEEEGDMESLAGSPGRRAALEERRRENQRHQRSLQWEAQDADELADEAARTVRLGTATMSSKERIRWARVIDTKKAVRGAPGPAPSAVEKQERGPSRPLFGAREDRGDDSSHLYKIVERGVAPPAKASFMFANRRGG